MIIDDHDWTRLIVDLLSHFFVTTFLPPLLLFRWQNVNVFVLWSSSCVKMAHDWNKHFVFESLFGKQKLKQLNKIPTSVWVKRGVVFDTIKIIVQFLCESNQACCWVKVKFAAAKISADISLLLFYIICCSKKCHLISLLLSQNWWGFLWNIRKGILNEQKKDIAVAYLCLQFYMEIWMKKKRKLLLICLSFVPLLNICIRKRDKNIDLLTVF